MTRPPRPMVPCGCGCGTLISTGGNGRAQYASGHRQRAYRKRRKAARRRAATIAFPTLERAVVTTPLKQRRGDAQRARKRGQASRSGSQVAYLRAISAMARDLIEQDGYDEVRAILRAERVMRGALSVRQRARLEDRETR